MGELEQDNGRGVKSGLEKTERIFASELKITRGGELPTNECDEELINEFDEYLENPTAHLKESELILSRDIIIEREITQDELKSYVKNIVGGFNRVRRVNELLKESFPTPFYRKHTVGNSFLWRDLSWGLIKSYHRLGLISTEPRFFLPGENLCFGTFGEGKDPSEERDGSLIRVEPQYESSARDYAIGFEAEFGKPATVRIVLDNFPRTSDSRVYEILRESEREKSFIRIYNSLNEKDIKNLMRG